MLGSQDDPRLDHRFGHTGEHTGKVNDKFGIGVRDESHIGIYPLTDLFVDLDLDLLRGCLVHTRKPTSIV